MDRHNDMDVLQELILSAEDTQLTLPHFCDDEVVIIITAADAAHLGLLEVFAGYTRPIQQSAAAAAAA